MLPGAVPEAEDRLRNLIGAFSRSGAGYEQALVCVVQRFSFLQIRGFACSPAAKRSGRSKENCCCRTYAGRRITIKINKLAENGLLSVLFHGRRLLTKHAIPACLSSIPLLEPCFKVSLTNMSFSATRLRKPGLQLLKRSSFSGT